MPGLPPSKGPLTSDLSSTGAEQRVLAQGSDRDQFFDHTGCRGIIMRPWREPRVGWVFVAPQEGQSRSSFLRPAWLLRTVHTHFTPAKLLFERVSARDAARFGTRTTMARVTRSSTVVGPMTGEM
jgi:hypothetical protein